MFHSLEITEIQKETAESVSITFDIPNELVESFVFVPGQYLTLKADIDGEEVRRSYSICSKRTIRNKLTIGVKQVENGKFSTYANKVLEVGQTLESMAPMGKFRFLASPEKSASYLLIAAGSGITPILSILQSILEEEPESKVTLIYGNRSIKSIMFKEQLEDLKNRFMSRFTLYHVLSRQLGDVALFNGRIDSDKLHAFNATLIDVQMLNNVYICGPEQMINSVQEGLTTLGVAKDKIHFELFGTQTQKKAKSTVDSEKDIELQIIHGGKKHLLMVSKDDCVLDVALESGTDLPFACKGGVCATCKAKLDSGSVSMELTYGLEQEEVDDGYILTCQAFPTSKNLVVNFDKAL